MRTREYFAFAMIAGFSYTEARRMKPGFVLDMYKARVDYDAGLAGAKLVRKVI